MRPAFEPPRKVGEGDALEDFCCGVPVVDEWARRRAKSAEKHGTAVVYVVCCEEHVAGLYSLSAHAVVRDEVEGGWLRRNAPEKIPAVLLGMLGVDERFQGHGLGSSLLGDAIRRAVVVSQQIGAKALLVDPVDDKARSFYAKYGFREVPGQSRMFISLRL
ncbi:MAG: GNAT family N-acetyltransferase [Eggerthellaceae bacterium]|nr:GNAT family N-acetyltransferase [Eggerthellaceae bacterium]